jgi:ribA/ribD-fused uncharacterized protein
MSLSSNIQIDDALNLVTVYGVKVHGDLFRHLTEPTPEDQWLRIIRDNDVVTVQRRCDETRPGRPTGPLKLDTDCRVYFYEQDHYYLSNFSAFTLRWCGITFPTSEHAYQWERFRLTSQDAIRDSIRNAPSAHVAFKTAQQCKHLQRGMWNDVKVDTMRQILRLKAHQHEYVRRKLLQTGDRELIENSWRDDYWGWGESRDGQNMLGKLWMEIRDELRAREIR